MHQVDDEVKGLEDRKGTLGVNKLPCRLHEDTEERKDEKTLPCVMNCVWDILENLVVPHGQAHGENCPQHPEDINVACKQGCQKECIDKPVDADTAEEGRHEDRGGGQAAEAPCLPPPSDRLDEDYCSKIVYTELMRNQSRSSGLATEAPQPSAHAEEQEKAPTSAAEEVAPLAPKRRRRDTESFDILKQIQVLRSRMCKLHKTDPRFVEAGHPDCQGIPQMTAVGRVNDVIGRNDAEGQRLQEPMYDYRFRRSQAVLKHF